MNENQRKSKGQSRINNAEKNLQHWAYKTQDEDEKKKHNPENQKDENHGPHQNPESTSGAREDQAVLVSHKTPAMLLIQSVGVVHQDMSLPTNN